MINQTTNQLTFVPFQRRVSIGAAAAGRPRRRHGLRLRHGPVAGRRRRAVVLRFGLWKRGFRSVKNAKKLGV